MMRLILTSTLAIACVGCTIDGPEPGSTGVMAELERQERIRQREYQRQRLCAAMSRDSDRYQAECARTGEAQ